jgi:UDP-GlcNAc:undecaprenyl-phosphate/decaprenyl-phosphate GlcNAc-1-phosphate transferase
MAEGVIEYISNDILLYGFLAQFLAAILSLYFVPTIRKLALAKKITDSPSTRKSHTTEVPVLGGVAVYLAAALSMFVIAFVFPSKIETSAFFLLAFGSMMLLFVGVVDDIVGLKPLHKLIFQLIVSFVLIHNTPLYINHMNGLFGFSEIAYISSLLLSVFVYVVFINMLNIIDGIDGLASGISVVAFLFFAYVSFFEFYYFNMLISMAGVGCLLPFMYYNIFSDKKIFLGDSGSLVMGVILGYLSLDYIYVDTTSTELLFGGNKIVILMSLFSYPLVDTLRVFVARILRKKSPFSADKNHIHHHLLRLGLSHRKATLFILIYTCFITCVSFSIKSVDINVAFLILLILAVTIICIPSFLIKNDAGSISFRKKA